MLWWSVRAYTSFGLSKGIRYVWFWFVYRRAMVCIWSFYFFSRVSVVVVHIYLTTTVIHGILDFSRYCFQLCNSFEISMLGILYIYIYGIWTRIRLVWCDEAMGRMVDDFGETAGMPTIEIVIMACYTCLKIIKFYCNLKLLWLPYHMIVYVLHGGEWVCLISWLCFSPHNYVAQLIINTNAYNNV